MFVLIFAVIPFGHFTTQSISSTLFEVLTAAEWNSMILVCDATASECPAEDVLSVHPAVFVSVDINNHSRIVQMFERHAASRQLNWLVFCTQCETLLNVINTFEDTHELQGYFKYKYQWMIVTNYNSLGATSLGDIMNLLVIDTDHNLYTSMFGMDRYFKKLKWPLEMHASYIFPNLLTGYNNITLVFVTIPWPPYIIKQASGDYSGYYVHLMDMIAQKLNFTYRITESFDGQYGSIENGEWTGMIRQLMDKKADIAGILTQSYERGQQTTQMSTALRVGYEVVMYHKPEPMAMSIDILVKPFSLNVWFVFLAILIASMTLFHTSQTVQRDNLFSGDYGTYILRSTLNQGAVWSPSQMSSRVIYGFYTVGWIILVATYTGYLVSFLSVKKDVIPFTTMSELAANSEYKLGILGGSYIHSVVLMNYTESTPFWHLQSKLLRDSIQDSSVVNDDIDIHHSRLLTEKYAYVGTSDTYLSFAADSCRIGILEEKGERARDGFVFQKNSAYTEDFDFVVAKIQEGELDRDVRKRFLPEPMQCTTSLSIVSLENIHGVFYILFGGLAVASLVLLVEMCSRIVDRWLEFTERDNF